MLKRSNIFRYYPVLQTNERQYLSRVYNALNCIDIKLEWVAVFRIITLLVFHRTCWL